MTIQHLIKSVFEELEFALMELPSQLYFHSCEQLSDATIGQHVRHVIELFQCLLDGYETGRVNYEKRQRDKRIETEKDFAVYLLGTIAVDLDKIDKDLLLEAGLGNENLITIHTNYQREMMYNLEHTIHHMALIRVAFQQMTDIVLPESFGVAPSTIQYRKTCVR